MHNSPQGPLTGTLVRRERNFAKWHPNQTALPGTTRMRDMGLFAKFLESVCWKDASLNFTDHTAAQLFLVLPAVVEDSD